MLQKAVELNRQIGGLNSEVDAGYDDAEEVTLGTD